MAALPTTEPTKVSVANPADPSKNVQDQLIAAVDRLDDLRNLGDKFTELRIQSVKELVLTRIDAESRIQNWMRDAEMKRLSGLDTQRQFFETRIASMLQASVESTSTLVSNQLVKIQGDLNDRVSLLERFRYETGGKTSISDPAIAEAQIRQVSETAKLRVDVADALTKMASSVGDLRTSGVTNTSRHLGQRDVIGWIVAGILFLVSVGGFGLALIERPATTPIAPPGYTLVPNK